MENVSAQRMPCSETIRKPTRCVQGQSDPTPRLSERLEANYDPSLLQAACTASPVNLNTGQVYDRFDPIRCNQHLILDAQLRTSTHPGA